LDFDDIVEEANEKHMTAWTKIITTSKPPVPNTALTAWIDPYMLVKHSNAYKGEKIKRIVGYRLKRPQFTVENIQEIINTFKAEGSWPIGFD
jgi:hypothetical protein